MIVYELVDGVMSPRLTPEYREKQYYLNNGSKMRVAICEGCDSKVDKNDYRKIMNSVIDGWQHEIQTYSHWTEDQKTKYMETQKKLQIIIDTKNRSDATLLIELEKFRKEKDGSNKRT